MSVQINTNIGFNHGSPYVDSLIWGGASWSNSTPINVGFWSGYSDAYNSPSLTWSADEMTAFWTALDNYSAVANITFNEVTPSESSSTSNPTDIIWYLGTDNDFGFDSSSLGSHEVPDGYWASLGYGDWLSGFFNTSHSSWSNLTTGSFGYVTIIHELGHAMGLAHPHDGGYSEILFPGVSSNGDTGDNALNQGIWTTMTYNDGWTIEPTSQYDYGWQMTLMAFDIAALQAIYGANTSTNTGNNNYILPTINQLGAGWSCIWDASGIDTISNAGSSQNSTINLNSAPLVGEYAGGCVSWVGGITGGFTIANGVVIENATGGSGNDIIIGNSASNILSGGGGNDTFYGGAELHQPTNGFFGVGEFQVNTSTLSSQDTSSIAGLNSGGFVVTWESWNQDGDENGVYAQMYDQNGNNIGIEFLVNTHTAGYQDNPDVAALNNGGFVVSWRSYNQDGDNYGIYAQIYNENGDAVGGEFQINTHILNSQEEAHIVVLSNGNFIISWDSNQQDADARGVFAQMYDTNGSILGVEFQINTYMPNNQGRGDITALNDGGFVATWVSYEQDGSSAGIYAQIYNENGVTIGSEFLVNSYTTSDQNYQSITTLNNGNFVITWHSVGQDSDNSTGVYAQIYSANGVVVGGEFQINSHTNDAQSRPEITALSDGGFVVVWHSNSQDGNNYGVFAQVFDSAGATVGSEFIINTYTSKDQDYPQVDALSNSGFVVTWTSDEQDGSFSGVFAQIFQPINNTDVGNDSINGDEGDDTLILGGSYSDYIIGATMGISTDDTVIITDASGNTTTITDVENFTFSDQLFTASALQANNDVRPLFASPQLENGTWVNSYILPDVFYSGNAGLDALYDYQYYGDNDGNILVASNDNDFINGFGGDDAINTGAGNDIVDGGLGSNFLTGGIGNDTFFSDGREAGNGAITWSTVTDFTDGANSVNIWGYIDGTSTYDWYADAGATGWTGATLHADLDGNGVIDTSMTFTGMDIADMSTPQGLEVGGNGYLLIG